MNKYCENKKKKKKTLVALLFHNQLELDLNDEILHTY